MEIMKRLVREEEGQGMVEYALIIGLISVVAITLLSQIGDGVVAKFQAIVSEFGTGTGTGTD